MSRRELSLRGEAALEQVVDRRTRLGSTSAIVVISMASRVGVHHVDAVDVGRRRHRGSRRGAGRRPPPVRPVRPSRRVMWTCDEVDPPKRSVVERQARRVRDDHRGPRLRHDRARSEQVPSRVVQGCPRARRRCRHRAGSGPTDRVRTRRAIALVVVALTRASSLRNQTGPLRGSSSGLSRRPHAQTADRAVPGRRSVSVDNWSAEPDRRNCGLQARFCPSGSGIPGRPGIPGPTPAGRCDRRPRRCCRPGRERRHRSSGRGTPGQWRGSWRTSAPRDTAASRNARTASADAPRRRRGSRGWGRRPGPTVGLAADPEVGLAGVP